jgi:hypothetical protein
LESGLAAVNAELAENPLDMGIHGGGLGSHPVRNFLIGKVSGEEGRHLVLAPGEAEGGIARPEGPGVVGEEGEGPWAKRRETQADVGEGAGQPVVSKGLEKAAGSTNAEAEADTVVVQAFREEHDRKPGKEVLELREALGGGDPRRRKVEEHDMRRRREGGGTPGEAPNSAERVRGQVERYAPGGFRRLNSSPDGAMQVLVLSNE